MAFTQPAKVVSPWRCPVLCVVRAHGVRQWQDRVLVLSLDQLTRTLRDAAGVAGEVPARTL